MLLALPRVGQPPRELSCQYRGFGEEVAGYKYICFRVPTRRSLRRVELDDAEFERVLGWI
ncbi:hypothetical protein BDU57DRAFT_516555 [Ampelomyces quisqualis]|uniref:Uncharacterized protein n=1 Tax=Ampelomyces quisqualis TaxID=50730 RepID=A0A6A5QM58_AMPQU|nr:hypothetical protein BDU57DRAFT_516555 [Ampelomyces quisqualis]